MIRKNLTPAVSYIRMSSGKQEASPTQQRREVKKLAEKHGYKILREYFDKGISGDATEKRKAFQQMIADAEQKGDFFAILCWDLSRFGRFDSIEAGHWIYPLRRVGVTLATVTEGPIDWNDFAGRMVYSIQAEGKHQFLRDLSRNVARGRAASMKAGTSPPLPVYGYDRLFYNQAGRLVQRVPHGEKFTKPKDWTVKLAPAEDGQSVETIRWMFKTYDEQDCGVHHLVRELNSKGIPSSKGAKWTWSTVCYVLKNPTYVGDQACGRKHGGKYHRIGEDGDVVATSPDAPTKRGEPLFLRQGTHEPIIDRDVFDRVQEKIASRKVTRTKSRADGGYLLTGVLFCGHCGSRLYGSRGGSKGNPYYVCSNGARRRSDCRAYRVQAKHAEPFILNRAVEAVTSPETLDRIRDELRQLADSASTPQGDTRPLKAKLRALDEKISKGGENLLLADAESIPAMSKVMAEWREERIAVQRELDAATMKPFDVDEAMKRAEAKLQRLHESLQSGDTPEVRAAIKTIVSKVMLYWEPIGKKHRVSEGSIEYTQSVAIPDRSRSGNRSSRIR